MLSLIKYVYARAHNDNKESPADTAKEAVVVSDETDDETLEFKEAELPQANQIEDLREEFPDVFLSNHRKVFGIVVKIEDNKLTVDSDYKDKIFILDLMIVKYECVQEVGDRVYVRCYVENEELFSGEIIETLEPFAVIPAVKKKRQKYIVKKVQTDLVELSNECFISNAVLKKCGDINLNVGDAVYADIIECNVENFKWRCINFTQTSDQLADLVRPPKNRSKSTKSESSGTQRLVLPTPTGRWHLYQNRLSEYANKVWSQEIGEFIPGGTNHSQRRFKAVRIPFYEVPLNIRLPYLTMYDKQKLCHQTIGKSYPSLQQDLTFENYLERFQALLWLEEAELFKNFRQYDMERVQFNVESDCLSLNIINLGERRPSIVIGDKVHAYLINTGTKDDNTSSSKPACFEGIVQSVLNDKISLKFHKMFMEKYTGEFFRLEFYFSRINFRRMHYGVHWAVQNLNKDFLFPKKVTLHDRPQLDIRMDENEGIMRTADNAIKWHNPNLNPIQRSAVFNILRGEAANMPYVIYGPPGTGKTITLVECILQLISNIRQSRLLVATPSNSAANLICSRLIESKGVHMGEMIRLVSYNSVDQVPENIMSYCATVDLGEDGTYKEEMFVTAEGMRMNCTKSCLASYRITIGTCSMLGKYFELGFNADHFTHVLVDEAGQCTEPNIMEPVSQVAKNRGQVILAGDPMQLNAIVMNKYASDKGLSTSFLERIMNTAPYRKDVFDFKKYLGYNPVIMTKLRQNYRALPSILRVYNYLFYDLELRSTISTTDSPEAELIKKLDKKVLFSSEIRPPSHGAFFYAVRGENVRERDSPSWCNPREANVVFNMTLTLYRNGVKPDDIGIITPYMKQVKHIRGLFLQANLKDPKIGSVEEFQGQERTIILISTVRTSKRELLNYDSKFGLGFVKCVRRLNVAISRARALLIVFGDPVLLQKDDCWGVYVGDCQHNDSFFGLKAKSQNENGDDNDDDDDNDNDDDDESESIKKTATK